MPCSFCKIPGHTVKKCNNEELILVCGQIRRDFVEISPLHSSKMLFTAKLCLNYEKKHLKAVARRYGKVYQNFSKLDYVDTIWRACELMFSKRHETHWPWIPQKFRIKAIMKSPIHQDSCHSIECSICFNHMTYVNTIVLGCEHKFCTNCVRQVLEHCPHNLSPTCGLCRKPIEKIYAIPNQMLQLETFCV